MKKKRDESREYITGLMNNGQGPERNISMNMYYAFMQYVVMYLFGDSLRRLDKEQQKEIVELLIGTWKKKIRKIVEPKITNHTEVMEKNKTRQSKKNSRFKDGEDLRLEINRLLSDTERDIRRQLDTIIEGGDEGEQT